MHTSNGVTCLLIYAFELSCSCFFTQALSMSMEERQGWLYNWVPSEVLLHFFEG